MTIDYKKPSEETPEVDLADATLQAHELQQDLTSLVSDFSLSPIVRKPLLKALLGLADVQERLQDAIKYLAVAQTDSSQADG